MEKRRKREREEGKKEERHDPRVSSDLLIKETLSVYRLDTISGSYAYI